MKFNTAYRILAEHQKWRRGEGKYAWSEDLAKRADMPYTPKQVGVAIDTALKALVILGEDAKEGGAKSRRTRAARLMNGCSAM